MDSWILIIKKHVIWQAEYCNKMLTVLWSALPYEPESCFWFLSEGTHMWRAEKWIQWEPIFKIFWEFRHIIIIIDKIVKNQNK